MILKKQSITFEEEFIHIKKFSCFNVSQVIEKKKGKAY